MLPGSVGLLCTRQDCVYISYRALSRIHRAVAVYGLHPNDVKTALEIDKENYVTKVMDNRYQTVEDGRDAANRNAVEVSRGRLQDFQEGYDQQKKKITDELQKQQQSDHPAKKATSTSGTYIDNAEYISDDF